MYLKNDLDDIKNQGLYKDERVIDSPQSSTIQVNGKKVLNFCANNYLGLSNHPAVIKAAINGIEKWGFGLSSVRFICGTQSIHKKLENKISSFLKKEDTILYTSCFDANGGLFETLLNDHDVIISDELNHASIIDGVRLCKAKRYRYKHSNMKELESILRETQNYNHRLITTDGVFSMDGYVAKLEEICNLARKYNALVHVDDSHATGFFGPTGRGSIEYCNVINDVDIITSTLGKALGGASGGFTSAKADVIDMLRQKSRPYLFSNSVAPSIVSASIAVLDILEKSTEMRDTLEQNTLFFRKEIKLLGYDIKDGVHPITPIMLYDAQLAKKLSESLLNQGIYVISFSYPVVPKDQARIRVQISASHSKDNLNYAIEAFAKSGKELGIIK
ncbi:MAG: glycine C-acetyltransferase [Candidatus Marinimicrobia bacterium]|mgnify:CR=1 FL=1|nr:glycine C-acetyltransferase [Candidatus Neomarinimicrobiota bacterium]|tara:strand:+ start:35283 stop:36452 length:1170 start_codon:yes stop_codon:yes gene_type:complete